jgi:hypothetical protein
MAQIVAFFVVMLFLVHLKNRFFEVMNSIKHFFKQNRILKIFSNNFFYIYRNIKEIINQQVIKKVNFLKLSYYYNFSGGVNIYMLIFMILSILIFLGIYVVIQENYSHLTVLTHNINLANLDAQNSLLVQEKVKLKARLIELNQEYEKLYQNEILETEPDPSNFMVDSWEVIGYPFLAGEESILYLLYLFIVYVWPVLFGEEF